MMENVTTNCVVNYKFHELHESCCSRLRIVLLNNERHKRHERSTQGNKHQSSISLLLFISLLNLLNFNSLLNYKLHE